MYLYIYIYIYIFFFFFLLDSRFWAPTSTSHKPVQGRKGMKKKVSFCRTEPLEWRCGVHAPVKGPPCNAENELSLWPLNRLACGHRAGFQIGNFGIFLLVRSFAWSPYFYSVSVQCPAKMLNLWAQFMQTFLTLGNQFEKWRAVLWPPNRRSEWDPKSKQKPNTYKKATQIPSNWHIRRIPAKCDLLIFIRATPIKLGSRSTSPRPLQVLFYKTGLLPHEVSNWWFWAWFALVTHISLWNAYSL